MSVKYAHASRAVCAYAYAVWKRPWCALIGACEVNKMNTGMVRTDVEYMYMKGSTLHVHERKYMYRS